jgi:eukaryotic translation initiation factor 2C
VDALHGFFQSVRPTEKGLVVNVDTATSAFFKPGPVIDVMLDILGRSPHSIRSGFTESEVTRLTKIMKGLEFQVTHRSAKCRPQKIAAIIPLEAHKATFEIEGGKTMTVASYFESKYSVKLKYDFLPCIQTKRKSIFPVEVCTITAHQKYKRKLGDMQISEMLKVTTVKPAERFDKIQHGLASLRYDANEYCSQFGFSVQNRPIQGDARLLDSPELLYHPSSQDPVVKPGFYMRNLRGQRLFRGATIDSWAVVVFARREEVRGGDIIQFFIRDFVKACGVMGLDVLQDQPPIVYGDSGGGHEQTLKRAYIAATEASGSLCPRILLCVLPRKEKFLYGTIKKITDTVLGLPSQCVWLKHFSNISQSRPTQMNYLCNVIMKVNVKLGGVNHLTKPTYLAFLSDKPSMILGADMSHPGVGERAKSIAALVGTVDARASRYASVIDSQASRVELIENIEAMTVELLRAFYRNSGQKPQRLLLYRDGVSEGAFEATINHEARGIFAACQALEDGYRPTLTYVTVQKRHHIRFYPANSSEGDKLGNCRPGTVLDNSITSPSSFDFYLQSHSSLKGTARPARYHVLLDENNFSADELQQLTYNLCHLFCRSTASVSLVTPVYYAHLLCARGTFHSAHFSDSSTMVSDDVSNTTYDEVKPRLRDCMYFM